MNHANLYRYQKLFSHSSCWRLQFIMLNCKLNMSNFEGLYNGSFIGGYELVDKRLQILSKEKLSTEQLFHKVGKFRSLFKTKKYYQE